VGVAQTVVLAFGGLGCKSEPTVAVRDPEPDPAPEPEKLWFDEQSSGDWSSSMRTLKDGHFSDFDGLKAPHMPASRIEMSWEQREKIKVVGQGSTTRRLVDKCLGYQLPKATLEIYEPFFDQADARKDVIRRSPKTVVWERRGLGQRGEFISEDITLGMRSLGSGLTVELCMARDAESGVIEMQATLAADWRLRPAMEFSELIRRAPAEIVMVVVGKQFETEAVFDLHDPKEVSTLRQFLEGHQFQTDAVEGTWRTQVGEVQLVAEVSPWAELPVELSFSTLSPLPVL
jgi:hypothetical protein